MALAYTPGLKVKPSTTIRKERRLPISGELLVKEGDIVSYDKEVARTLVKGGVQTIHIYNDLDVEPGEIHQYLLKKEGDNIEKDELIAYRESMFGLSKHSCRSPVRGKIELISKLSGQIIIAEEPIPVEVEAYIPGKIVEVLPKEGVTVECRAAFIQGIFGVGGETQGELLVITDSSNGNGKFIGPEEIGPECKGKILVGRNSITTEGLKKAQNVGVKGIVVGGVEDKALSDLLGYQVGVAITGNERVGLTLIITEGFGHMEMSTRTYNLLKSLEGKLACMNGATQIRAGVIRPEIIIPLQKGHLMADEEEPKVFEKGMEHGMPVRIIRQPHFGAIGKIVGLPVELKKTASESSVRVAEVELNEGRKVTVPRANLEIIEE
jgi:hypothetical protein